jgi:3-oxoacyl-[acyl-carrier protein] reductase
MECGIEGRVSLVCGASSGIGEACARALAGEGVRTILLARNEKRLSHLVRDIKASGGEAQYLCADLSNTAMLEHVSEEAQALYGKVDILINNTGGPPTGDNLSFSSDVWEKSFRATFLSAMTLTHALIPAMAERGWGRVINLASITVKQPIEGLILSNSIRMAVVGWAKTLSLQFAAKHVTVNTIATGYTMTERVLGIARKKSEQQGISESEVLRGMTGRIPMKRMADPAEIASLALFLAGECSSYITGATIPIDGGFALSVL